MKKKISEKFSAEIRELLSGHGFSSEDFLFLFKNEMIGPLKIEIMFKYNQEYYLNAEMVDSGKYFNITYSPGEVMSPETEKNLSKERYLEAISDWISNLREELKSTTIGRIVYENEVKLQNLEAFVKEKFTENGETFFSQEEGYKLKEKLDEFEKMFQEQIENQNTEDKKIHEEVQLLKEQIEYLSKRNWTTSIGVKILNWGSRNPHVARKVGRVALTAILPEEVKSSFPELLPPEE